MPSGTGTRRLYVEEVVQYRPVCVFPLQTALVSLLCSVQCLLARTLMMDLRLVAASLILAAVLPALTALRDSSCPRICTTHGYGDPVCGSDGIIYPNICELRKKTCGKGVKLSPDPNLCKRSSGSKCEHRCGSEKDLVCGTDGRTYLNRCMLEVEICRLGIALSHLGPCNNISAHRENCPVDCKQAPQDGPICGSDGNVYKSTCQMKLLTCGQGVVRTDKKYCQTTRHCRESCWRNARPTCGSDGKIYANVCRMKSKNCGKHVFEVPMAYCASQERTSHSFGCPLGCGNEIEKPICGSDGYVYRHECEMKLLNCGSNRRVTKVDFEKCKSKLSKCLKMKCPNDVDPVCGTDARTYTNQCQLNLATCLKGVQFAHVGNCTALKEQVPCPTNCDNENEEPVCGSDGNVYKSMCHLRKETCGQLVTEVPLHHCRTTALCNEKCPEDKNFVCGSDNKIYRSECEMKRDNCGKHIFVVPMKRCLSGFLFRGCQKICPTYYDPVCGSDNMTYSNTCFLEIENCRSRSLVTMRHMGTCAEPINEIPKNYLY
ncbi:Agrin-like Protein [Tribolium castaneum]|uniref:Agrin-like Protein n=2 Tax=Tribolium castaneum TaxID=7070 RepID=D6WQS6_TRICA|nr:PREDICTED: serine protease inhibitor dipetalogastin [Tribolium castaneum]EFA06028.2 Agrin-like Protein [Tribolium castaneum]|eukprot:XP_975339.3 PREDICTED: serine protease inhibitor dipetalogastin [Tribolium castaneum]